MNPGRLLPALSCAALAGWLALSSLPPRAEPGRPDAAAFARLPVLHNGRVKPLDTVARTTLLTMSGRQTVSGPDGRSLSADEWLLDVLARPDAADRLEAFAVDHPDVLGLMGKKPGLKRRWSFDELSPSLETVSLQAERARGVEAQARSGFEAAVVKLHDDLVTYQRLKNSVQVWGTEDLLTELRVYEDTLSAGVDAVRAHEKGRGLDRKTLRGLAEFLRRYEFLASAAAFRPLPPEEGRRPDEWATMGDGLLQALKAGRSREGARDYAAAASAWKRGDAAAFGGAVSSLSRLAERRAPRAAAYASWEALFNRVEPFYKGIVLYVAVLLLVSASWLGPLGPELRKAAYASLGLAFAVHLCALLARMLLQGRPPVTNLYSSAVFVGAVAVGLSLAVERWHRRGIAVAAGSLIGFSTLIVAHHLAAAGDTLEMMRAVLDSNFWLGTHVVTVTIGYSSTFLAGALAHAFILRGAFTRGLSKGAARQLGQMTYGVVCFALLFSFVGTILGGIWADQSWGRFWGWDPKENGALMIVLWNAMLLHARFGGYVKQRGFMVMAVFGCILTAFSWFGVNMLGIGLHSYGWMQQAFWWLAAFIALELGVILLGLLPERRPVAS